MGFLPLLQAGEAAQHPLETSALPAARRQRGRFHPNCTCLPALLSSRTVPHLFLQVPYQEMLKKPPQLPTRNKASSTRSWGIQLLSHTHLLVVAYKLLYSLYVNSVNQLLQSSSVFHYNLRDCIFNYGRSGPSTLPYKHIFCLCSPKNCYLKGRRRGLGEEKKESL